MRSACVAALLGVVASACGSSSAPPPTTPAPVPTPTIEVRVSVADDLYAAAIEIVGTPHRYEIHGDEEGQATCDQPELPPAEPGSPELLGMVWCGACGASNCRFRGVLYVERATASELAIWRADAEDTGDPFVPAPIADRAAEDRLATVAIPAGARVEVTHRGDEPVPGSGSTDR